MSEDMIERVALAIYAARGSVGLRENCMDDARAAIAAHETALAEAGFVIVPREPTESMVAAAGRYNHPRDAEVWGAMIDAALRSHAKPA